MTTTQISRYDQFHDGYLDGFWIEADRIHVFLRTEDGASFVAVADKVLALSAEEFRAGNIILDLLVRSASEITSQDIARLYRLRPGDVGEKQKEALRSQIAPVGGQYSRDQSVLWWSDADARQVDCLRSTR
jgi:uncharacterized protein YcaQ